MNFPLSFMIARILLRAGKLFRAGEIRLEKGRLLVVTGSLTNYIKALRGNGSPAMMEPMMWFASEIGPMVRFRCDLQSWSPNCNGLLAWINGAEKNPARANLLLSRLLEDTDRDRVRALLFLLVCFSETAEGFATPILDVAEEEGLELPYVVGQKLLETLRLADVVVAQRLATPIATVEARA